MKVLVVIGLIVFLLLVGAFMVALITVASDADDLEEQIWSEKARQDQDQEEQE